MINDIYNNFGFDLYRVNQIVQNSTNQNLTTNVPNDMAIDPNNIQSGNITSTIDVVQNAIRGGKNKFDNILSGFILGLDNGTYKFYIGNSTNYFNWDGSAVTISGSLTATTGTIGGFTISASSLQSSSGTTFLNIGTSGIIQIGQTSSRHVILDGGGGASKLEFYRINGGKLAQTITTQGNGVSNSAIIIFPNYPLSESAIRTSILITESSNDNAGNIGLLEINANSGNMPTALYLNSANGVSHLRLSAVIAPTSPSDGDIWYDGTNVKIRVGAVTKTFTIT